MHIREFGKPVTAKSLNETLSSRYGSKINLDKFTLEQLQDVRNKLRTKLSQVETYESFDSVHEELYSKTKLMLDVLNAAISERGDIESETLGESYLSEGAEDRAELVMAAKDMVDRITSWMEDTAEMQTESMLELADAIRDEMGQAASDQFTNSIKPALENLYDILASTRETLTAGVGTLTGEVQPESTIGAEDDIEMEPTTDMELDSDEDITGDDEFASSEPATGGDESAGRAKRESIERVAEKKSYSAKSARAGKDIGKPGKQFSKIAKSAGEKYGSKERGEKVAGAVLKKLRTKESVNGFNLIQSIAKKK